MASFSERLAEALRVRHITAAELARHIGVNEGTISNYKKGTYEPKQRRTEEIASVLNVSIPWLMGADVPMRDRTDMTIPTGFSALPHTVKRPRLGAISCGEPLMSEENFDGYDDVPEDFNCDFTLKCEGDSMIGARINSGDIVFIRYQDTIESGQIAAVLVDGEEKLLKRIFINNDSVVLQAENPLYSPLVFAGENMNRIRIIGRAIGFASVIK